jgi:hypothetical protein
MDAVSRGCGIPADFADRKGEPGLRVKLDDVWRGSATMREALDALDGSKRRHPHLDTLSWAKLGQAFEQVTHRGGELWLGVRSLDIAGDHRVHRS